MPKVTISLTKVRCLEETDEPSASDEPYVLVFSAHLVKVGGLISVPSAITVKYGPWSADKGDLLTTQSFNPALNPPFLPGENFWGLDGKPRELSNLNDVIFLAGLMENDDAQTGGIRAGLHAQMFASIVSYANSGMSRSDMVSKLKKDMRDILTGVIVTGIPSSDDLIGVSEVRFKSDALQKVASNTQVKGIVLSGDGGEYRLRFEMIKA